MRILLVSSSSGSQGGGELFLLGLGESLVRQGHEAILWTANHSRMDALCARFARFGEVLRRPYRNTYDRRFRSFSDAFDFSSARRVARDWRSLRPDVLHINKQNLEDGMDLLRAAGRVPLPSLSTVHITQTARFLKARFPAPRDWLARAVLDRFPGFLVAPGESRLVDLKRFLRGRPRLARVENGVAIPSLAKLVSLRVFIRERLQLAPDQVLGLAVGRMVEQKRPLLFLDLAERFLLKHPWAVFCWVGDGPLRPRWEAQIAARGLRGKIFSPGWIDDLAPYYAAGDFLLHTAGFEGLPLAILEAMAARLPCAVTPELHADLQLADCVLKTDGDHWMDQLSDAGVRSQLANLSRERAENDYSVERMSRNYLDLYRRIAQEVA